MHAKLALGVRISEIYEYMMYRNEHRSSKILTTLSLSLIGLLLTIGITP